MKQLILGATLLFISLGATAQAPSQKGNSQFNLGVGISNWGVPVYMGFGYGISNDITLGVETSLRFFTDNVNGVDYNHSILGLLVNANYHFNRAIKIPANFDLYAGVGIGVYAWTSPANYIESHTSGLNLSAQVGGRYFLSKNVGLNLEISGGNALSGGKLGLTFRL